MPKRVVTPEVVSSIREMTSAGIPPAQISKELDIAVPTVYRVLAELGQKPARTIAKHSWQNLSEEDVQAVIEQYTGGVEIREIIADYDLNHNALYALLQECKIPPRTVSSAVVEARETRLDHACELYEHTALTIAQIVSETGVSQPTLHSELRVRGIPLRRPRRSNG